MPKKIVRIRFNAHVKVLKFTCITCVGLQKVFASWENLNLLLGVISMLVFCNHSAVNLHMKFLVYSQVTIIFVVSVSVFLFVCLFVCAQFFSAVFDPISIILRHMLCVWV